MDAQLVVVVIVWEVIPDGGTCTRLVVIYSPLGHPEYVISSLDHAPRKLDRVDNVVNRADLRLGAFRVSGYVQKDERRRERRR